MVPVSQREIPGRKALWKRNESAIIAETKRLTVLVTGVLITRKHYAPIVGNRFKITLDKFQTYGIIHL